MAKSPNQIKIAKDVKAARRTKLQAEYDELIQNIAHAPSSEQKTLLSQANEKLNALKKFK